MLRKARRILNIRRNQYSLFKKYPQLETQLQLYRESQQLINSDDYKQIQKLLRIEYAGIENKFNFEKEGRNLLLTEPDYISSIIDLYFKYRNKYGYSEKLIVSLLKLLFIHSRIHENWTSGTDIGMNTFYKSEKFLAILKDIRILATHNHLGNYNVSKTVIDNLRGLRYKSFEIVKIFCNKIYYELFNEEYIPGTFDSIESFDKIHADGLIYERLDNILESDQFVGFMNRVINAVDFKDTKENYQETSENNGNIIQFEIAMNQVVKTVGNLQEKYLQLFDSICQMRDYYMKLKETEKFNFIKNNPQLYLDFLTLEEELIKAGVIMPKDVVDDKNSYETTELILEQIIIQNGYEEDYLGQLFKTFGKNNDKKESYQQYMNESNLKERENIFRLIFTLTDYIAIRTPYSDLTDIYSNPRFNDIFERSIPKNYHEDFVSKLHYFMDNKYRYVDMKSLSIANFYYTKPFIFLRDFFFKVLSRLDIENETPRAIFYINVINKKLMIPQDFKNNLDKQIENKLVNNEFVIDMISTFRYLNSNLIDKLSEKYLNNELLNFFESKINDYSIKFSYKILLVQYLALLKLNPKCNNYHKKIDKIIISFVKEENLEYCTNTERKYLIPLSEEKRSVMSILLFIKAEYSEAVEQKGLSDKLSNTLQFLYRNRNLDWEAGYYYDPVYVQVFNALQKNYSQESDLTSLCFNYKDELPQDIHPHFLFNNGDKLLGVYLNNPQDSKEEGTLYLKSKIVSHLFKKKFGIDIEIRNLEIEKCFKNPQYYVDGDFELDQNTKYIEEIMDRDRSNDINKITDHIYRISNNPKNFDHSKKEALNILKFYTDKISKTIDKFGLVDNKLKIECIVQLRFILNLLAKLSMSNEARTNLNTLSSSLSGLESTSENFNLQQSKYAFEGIRLGLSGYKSNSYFAKRGLEILNYRFFKNKNYFVISEWKDELNNVLGPLDYKINEKEYLVTNMSTLDKMLLPKVGGRNIIASEFFSLYWDYKSMGNSEEKGLSEEMERILKAQNKVSINDKQNYKISLLNMMYQFRTLDNFDQFFNKFFNLPFWNKFVEKINEANEGEIESVYSDTIVSNVLFQKNQPINIYKEKIEGIKDIKEKLNYYQKLINEIIPQEYANTIESYYKNSLYEYWNKIKEDYFELLHDYKTEFAEEFKTQHKTPFKDVINTLIYQHEESNSVNDQSTNNVHSKGAMLKVFNEILKLFLIKTSTSSDKINSLKAKYHEMIGAQTFLEDIHVTDKLHHITIGELFNEEDYDFFNYYLSHASLKDVKNSSISDLLITLGLMIDKKVVEAYEVKFYVDNVYNVSGSRNDLYKTAIINLFDNRISNANRFAHDYAQNYLYQKSLGVNEDDKQKLEEILKIMRGKFKRQKKE